MTTPTCRHALLVLLPPESTRLRCRHCHLTITAEELGSGDCPECRESQQVRRRDFEVLPADTGKAARYRCDECGILIEC